MKNNIIFVLSMVLISVTSTMAHSAKCGKNSSGFQSWLSQIKKEARAKGISKRAINSSLNGVKYSRRIIHLDRNQKSFKLSFRAFYKRRVNNVLINQGKKRIRKYSRTFRQIEKRFGVPASVLTAIWGLETNFGRLRPKLPIMTSLATLAYDCRRTKFFTNELFSALKIVDRGHTQPSRMKGAWAGEIGQTQFMASSYYKFAIDFDGNGRADLINSVPDVLASTANYLKSYGWKRGAGWNPGTSNYKVLQQWNRAEVYSKTIAVMANKLSGR